MSDTASRLPDPDRAYRLLIEAHRGLSDEESAALNTRLVLVLANALGDLDRLAEAIEIAKAARGDAIAHQPGMDRLSRGRAAAGEFPPATGPKQEIPEDTR